MTYTPMIYTARLVKREQPEAKVVFVGPCAAKKLEAMQAELRSDVDFVLTYEELMGIFEAKEIDFAAIEPEADLQDGSGAGRGFASAGGIIRQTRTQVRESTRRRRSGPSGQTACASAASS